MPLVRTDRTPEAGDTRIHLIIAAPSTSQRRRAARWTLRRRLVCLITEQLTPGRHVQPVTNAKEGQK
ncbi:hypothetical protein [Pseudarthrobacter siccitolerans]